MVELNEYEYIELGPYTPFENSKIIFKETQKTKIIDDELKIMRVFKKPLPSWKGYEYNIYFKYKKKTGYKDIYTMNMLEYDAQFDLLNEFFKQAYEWARKNYCD